MPENKLAQILIFDFKIIKQNMKLKEEFYILRDCWRSFKFHFF